MTTDVTDQRAPLTWAAILEHPGADPVRDRHELTAPGIRALIVPVPPVPSPPRSPGTWPMRGYA